MQPIGFSTGCLYKTKTPLREVIQFYKHVGATAVELGFGHIDELFAFTPSAYKNILASFSYISVHAPMKGIHYTKTEETTQAIQHLQHICATLPVKGITIHPDVVENMQILQDSALPFLLENMDKRKPLGFTVEEFEAFNALPFNYVLDVQHAYEHDNSMQLVKDLQEVMGTRLQHVHVSGQTTNSNHALVCEADNKENILSVVPRLNVPIILEGMLPGLDEELAKRELSLLQGMAENL